MIWGNKEPAIKDRHSQFWKKTLVWKIHKMAVWSQDCLNYYPAILDILIPVSQKTASVCVCVCVCVHILTYTYLSIDNTVKWQFSLRVFV